ncbi:MAG: hypothetical protein ACTSWG_13290 [Candidatus Helarchaeota archaeon]
MARKRGRPKLIITARKIDETCYVCGKHLKSMQGVICIGQGKYRHKRCNPGLPKFRRIWFRNPKTIVKQNKRKSRQQIKIDLKKGKE